jgi:uncharacterized protein (DUF302 family)
MTDYGMSVVLDSDLDTARAWVEAALADQGFGVLTEIDVAATLQNKIGKKIPPQVILGACNPHLADRALEAEPSIGLLLPCNIVLRDSGDGRTVVSALSPSALVTFTGNPALEPIAAEAHLMLIAALDEVTAASVR